MAMPSHPAHLLPVSSPRCHSQREQRHRRGRTQTRTSQPGRTAQLAALSVPCMSSTAVHNVGRVLNCTALLAALLVDAGKQRNITIQLHTE